MADDRPGDPAGADDSDVWVNAFEAAYAAGGSPALADFVRDQPPERRRRVLDDLIPYDLDYRWQRADAGPPGERPPRVEDYAAAFPELDTPERPLSAALIQAEFVNRRRYDRPRPTLGEYRERFGGRWAEIGPILEAAVEAELSATRPADPAAVQQEGPLAPPRYIDLVELGHGGMGVVYRAYQPALGRTVALKAIRDIVRASPEARERFRREAQAAAGLHHPNIVQLYEVGEWDFGSGPTPFLALEYVEGGTLADHLRRGPLPPRDAAALVATLADAVAYAHKSGIVHRDLKPANVLLQKKSEIRSSKSEAPFSDFGLRISDFSPKVSDFGLAKRLDADDNLTRTGAVLGTIRYMAPEQAAGRKDVGPAADVYGLGAILYECLTGRPPFAGDSELDVLRRVADTEPDAPSRHSRGLPRDLETVCLKCLQKEPARRYGSAAALADDLRRWLAGRPVVARPVGVVGRTWRWSRRNRLAAGLMVGMGLALVMVLGLVIALVGERWRMRWTLYVADLDRMAAAWRDRDFERLGVLLNRHEPGVLDRDVRGFEWHYWDKQRQAAPLTFDQPGDLNGLAVLSDGRHAVTAGSKTVCVWDLHERRLKHRLLDHTDKIQGLAVAADGSWMATGGGDRQLIVWDPRTGARLGTIPHPDKIQSLAALPGGRVLTWAESGWLRVWDVASGTNLKSWHVPGEASMSASPDGRRIHVKLFKESDTVVWDLETGRQIGVLPGDVTSRRLAHSPDGRRLATGTWTGSVEFRDPETGQPQGSFFAHRGGVNALSYSPDGRRLVTQGNDTWVRVWDATTHRRLASNSTTMPQGTVVFTPDGRHVLFGGGLGTVIVWPLDDPDRLRYPGMGQNACGVAFRPPNGRQLAAVGRDGVVRIWDVASGRDLAPLTKYAKQLWAVTYSPDGRLVAAGGDGGAIALWEADSGKLLRTWRGHGECTWSLAFSPDGRHLASGGFDRKETPQGMARVWDLSADREVWAADVHEKRTLVVAYSPDGTQLVTAGSEGTVRTWDARTGAGPLFQAISPRDEDRAHGFAPAAVAWRPNGRQLAAAGLDAVVRVWDPRTGKLVRELRGCTHEVWSVAYSPDGKRVAAACHDGAVRLWDPDTGDLLLTVRGDEHERRWNRLAFSLTEGLVTKLVPGGSDTFTLRLDSWTAGTKSGEVRFATNDADESPYNFTITGTVTTAPEASVEFNGTAIADGDTTPSTADGTDFGSVLLGGTPLSRNFTVRNDGTATLTLGSIYIPAGFSLTEALVTNLAPGASDTFTLRLDSWTAGAKGGEVRFATDDADESPYNFAVVGTVMAPEASIEFNGVAVADGDASPSAAEGTDFGSVALGGAPVSRIFTVRNDGTATLTLGSIYIPAGFSLTEGLVTNLAPGASDTFTLRLDTWAAGAKAGEVRFATDDADESPYNFSVAGAVTAPEATVEGNAVAIADGDATPSAADGTDFGSVLQGGTPISRNFTVRNDGTATLALGSVYIPAGFSLTEALATSLAPGASDTFTLRLDDWAEGTKSGEVRFATNDADESPYNFAVTGTVTDPSRNLFASAVNYQVGAAPTDMAAADFNGDGRLDLAVANVTGNSVSILLNNGGGAFQPAVHYPTGVGSFGLAASDFNGDGKIDLFVTNYGPNNGPAVNQTVLLGTGNGTFTAISSFVFPTSSGVAAADFNGDGKADLAILSQGGPGYLSVYLGNGNATFTPTTNYSAGYSPRSVRIADLNGDGKLDIAVSYSYAGAGGTVGVFLGDGTGAFSGGIQYTVGLDADQLAVGDFNEDGKLDLASANFYASSVSILQGHGNGTFQPATTHTVPGTPGTSGSTAGLAVADFNGDGHSDIVATNFAGGGAGNVAALLGYGNGTFQTNGPYAVGIGPFYAITADFNNDGRPDVAITNLNSASVSILLNVITP